MSDLETFIRARLGEDALLAEADWSPVTITAEVEVGTDGRSGEPVMAPVFTRAWTPERMLREVEAKRAILGKYERALTAQGFSPAADAYVSDMEWTARILAAVYRDHPDYDETWKTGEL